jgi:chromosome segregation ATPase
MNDEVNRVLYTLTGLAPSEVAVPETVGPDGLRSDETMPPVSHIIDQSSVPEGLMDDVASLIKRREAKGNRSPPNAALQHACDAAKAERDAAVAERERLRKATQSQLHDAREKIKHLEAQHAADSQKLLARCSGAAAELSTLQANITASSAENTQLQKQLHDSMAQLTVSSADLGRIRAEAARVLDQVSVSCPISDDS